MRKVAFTLLLLLSAQAGGSSPAEEFSSAFERELNNRALAGDVVTVLANHHDGAQGRFWAAYAELEQRHWPVYQEYAECYGSSVGRFTVWIKARASTVFARLFPERFISMLADSTRAYTETLESTPVPDNRRDQRLWDYVLTQERAQVRAFSYAEKGEFAKAAEQLSSFTSSHAAGHELLPAC